MQRRDLVLQILRDAGKPMHEQTILYECSRRGNWTTPGSLRMILRGLGDCVGCVKNGPLGGATWEARKAREETT